VYETLEGDGEPLRSGRVLSAEFVNKGKTFQALWFQDPAAAGPQQAGLGSAGKAKGAYYTLDGESLQRSFLISPLAFSRVTSGFKQRFHPILQRWMAHLGVDYGAPTGTAVRTVSNGVVEFAGVQNGFGNVVYVNHGKDTVTVYAHLSRIDVKRGQNISQGETLGAVGSTGWATGPHLHFEFRIKGVHQDPLTVAHSSETQPVSAAARALFDRQAAMARTELAAAASIRATSTE
jgi:murein DD-endopeptidase MepM/ murein hydrolase activator NlpD